MKKSCKKLTRTKKTRDKIRGWFELSPSRQPLRHKALWDMETELLSDSTTAGITEGSISSHLSCFSSLYSTHYLWLDYSQFLYNVYEVRSVSGYPFIRKLDYVRTIYSEQIDKLFDNLVDYYKKDLGISDKYIKSSKLKHVCSWFIFHLHRVLSGGFTGIKFAFDRNFYSDYLNDGGDKLSGSVVQNLIKYLSDKEGVAFYKGYSFEINEHESKSCMSLLLLPKELMLKYGNPKKVKDSVVTKKPLQDSKTFCEVREESGKKKTVIAPEDYKEEWMDKIKATEKFMSNYLNVLNNSVVRIGRYEIPEHHFKRIWIKDVYTYGRLHDDGTFQTKSSKLRKQIVIDDQETVTVDLSSLHPRLLYTIKGIELTEDFDPYPNVKIKLDNRRINKFKDYYNIDTYDPIRNLVKVGMLILINANSDVSAVKALENKLKIDQGKLQTRKESDMQFIGIPEDIDLKGLLEGIKRHNVGISEYFAKGIATKLMNMDSDILVEAIDCLVQLDIVCLPLHDSLTVKVGFEEECIKALEYGYEKVMGTLMNFKCKVEC